MNSLGRELTHELQRLLDVVLNAETDADREAAVEAIEALVPRWHRAVRPDESDDSDDSDESLMREVR